MDLENIGHSVDTKYWHKQEIHHQPLLQPELAHLEAREFFEYLKAPISVQKEIYLVAKTFWESLYLQNACLPQELQRDNPFQ